MSPLMMRFFTLVGVALAAASMQLRARADTLPARDAAQVQQVVTTDAQAHVVGAVQSLSL